MKIEPGCMAVIINSKMGNNGKVVNVISNVGKIEDWYDVVFWETDLILLGSDGVTDSLIPEYQLMRIDGFKEDTTQESKEIAHG